MIKTYTVNGMTCVICKANVEKALCSLSGVRNVKVSLLENEVTIDYDEKLVDENKFYDTLKEAGYSLVINKTNTLNYELIKLVIATILMISLMIISMFYMNRFTYIEWLLSTIIIILNINIYSSGFKSLSKMNPNMNSLVSISSLASYIYSVIVVITSSNNHLYFETSAMVLFIVSVGKYIERNTTSKTTKVIRGLSTLIPMQANLIEDNQIKIIPINDLKKNMVVRVYPGESIPQDGEIINGNSLVDESLITGESLLVNKNIHDQVIGGTINTSGTIDVKITTVTSKTVLSNIINITKQTTSSKLPIERVADKIAKYFVFTILSIADITFIVWWLMTKDFEIALNYYLSVLVISCPCALGLATPACVAVSCGVAAKLGILIKKPEVLELAGKTTTIIFDKTGTLTHNKLKVVEIKSFDESFINVLSSLEKTSSHPIAKTIVDKYPNGNINFETSELIDGLGIKATLNNDIYLAGNNNLVKISNEDIDYAINNNYSYFSVSKNNKLLGIVYLSDIYKVEAKDVIDKLNNLNIKTIMCTGDNEIAASKLAKELNINKYLFNCKPSDKNELVNKEKENGVVMMCGDGVNDAIGLSNADISISIKDASEIAQASSDVILINKNLNSIINLYKLAKKTMRIIKQNLFWALGYNAICIPLAAGCLAKYNFYLNPMIGSILMWLSSMFVLMNALRINKFKGE